MSILGNKGRTIMLAGFARTSRAWVDEQPKTVEVWSCNEAPRLFTRVDRLFQLHPRTWREEERRHMGRGYLPQGRDPNCFGRNKSHIDDLKAFAGPIYTQRLWDDLPTSTVYPFAAVRDRFGVPAAPSYRKRLYITDSFAYMVALACLEHTQGQTVKELRFGGVELYGGREGRWELPSVCYWVGIAQGLGIAIGLPPTGTSLLNAPLYAIEGPYPGTVDSEAMPGGMNDERNRGPSLVYNPNSDFYDLVLEPRGDFAVDQWWAMKVRGMSEGQDEPEEVRY